MRGTRVQQRRARRPEQVLVRDGGERALLEGGSRPQRTTPAATAEPSGASDAQKLQSVATTDRELIRRVDALVPPEAEQDQVDQVLEAWRKRADLEDQYAAAVAAMQDPATLAVFAASQAQIDATTDPVAVQLGLTACTRGTP
jgi:hypothetical protein